MTTKWKHSSTLQKFLTFLVSRMKESKRCFCSSVPAHNSLMYFNDQIWTKLTLNRSINWILSDGIRKSFTSITKTILFTLATYCTYFMERESCLRFLVTRKIRLILVRNDVNDRTVTTFTFDKQWTRKKINTYQSKWKIKYLRTTNSWVKDLRGKKYKQFYQRD